MIQNLITKYTYLKETLDENGESCWDIASSHGNTDVSDYIMVNGDTYEQTTHNQSIDDFESEPRKCHCSRKALVQFETENHSIDWALDCDLDTPELFEATQCGTAVTDSEVTFYCWCADKTSGKRLNDVKLGSLFNPSTCE